MIDIPIMETEEEIVELPKPIYDAMCDAISEYRNQLASYEAQVTKLLEVINAQDQSLEKIRDFIQAKAENHPKVENIQKFDSCEISNFRV